MSLINLTKFEAKHAVGMGGDGCWQVTVVVKATYTWDPAGVSCPAPSLPILTADEFAGDPAVSGLLRACELTPAKPRVDVLLAGSLVFPKPIAEVEVELAIGTRLCKRARVFGDRVWLPGALADLVPSRPHPVDRVPIAWEHSYGGADPEDGKHNEPRNPAGSGVARNPRSLHGRPAPNFESPDKPIGAVFGKPIPVGFGPIAPHWQPRVALAGRYDEAWEKSRRPLLPADFKPEFFNVAPADQQLPAYQPGERVRLRNLTAAADESFVLPVLTVPVTMVSSGAMAEEVALVDTLIIEPEERRFSLLAKAQASLGDGPESLGSIVVGELTRGMRSALESGKQFCWERARGTSK
ncbi:MAG TPA: DUF2169 domain-containing protein [Polyangia bacterium]